MASAVFNKFKQRIMDGTIDLDTDGIWCALVSSAYTVNIDTQDDWTDVSSNEITEVATGYNAGGTPLEVTVTVDDTDDEGVFDAADAIWISSTITARGAILYSGATGSPLICWIDFGADKSSSAGDFKITWAAEGILNLN